MARYLVTGGAGFVGSHAVLALLDRGDEVVVLDDLSQGHRAAVPAAANLVQAPLSDRAELKRVFAHGRFDAVLHFAALSLVGESMKSPMHYLAENLGNSVRLIEAAVEAGTVVMRRDIYGLDAAYLRALDAPRNERLAEASPRP